MGTNQGKMRTLGPTTSTAIVVQHHNSGSIDNSSRSLSALHATAQSRTAAIPPTLNPLARDRSSQKSRSMSSPTYPASRAAMTANFALSSAESSEMRSEIKDVPSIHTQLLTMLQNGEADFQVMEHVSAGKSEEVAEARGTEVGQGAKALACKMFFESGVKRNVLAVMPADCRLDKAKLASCFGAKKVKLLSVDDSQTITRCVVGAIPPFSFSKDLELVCDPELPNRYKKIAFNAGRLDTSIIMDVNDYLRLAQPKLFSII